MVLAAVAFAVALTCLFRFLVWERAANVGLDAGCGIQEGYVVVAMRDVMRLLSAWEVHVALLVAPSDLAIAQRTSSQSSSSGSAAAIA